MANVSLQYEPTSYSGLNMSTIDPLPLITDIYLVSDDKTVVTYFRNNRFFEFTGTGFTFVNEGGSLYLTGGVVTRVNAYDQRGPSLSDHLATGLSFSVATAQTILAGGQGASGYFGYLFGGDDVVTGTARSDVLIGYGGADSMSGLADHDRLDGGAGNDTVSGGSGNDTVVDSSGANYLRGDEGDDSITGGADFDDINGNMGADTCVSGDGDDWVVGGRDNDSLVGGAGQNLVYGNLGADTCEGGDGNDIIRGGQDDDVCLGGAGNDFVSGDKGSDTMTGGAGADVFHTFGDAGLDRVTDFNLAQGDRVQLDPGTQYTITQSGDDTVISMSGGAQMILVGVQASTLTAGWIFGA